MTMPSENGQRALRYLRPPRPITFPAEAEVPESLGHLEIRTALFAILKHSFKHGAMMGSEQFVYWDPTNPSECVAPDAFLQLGSPYELFDSWKVWERGAPHLAVEIVSGSDAAESIWTAKLAKYHRLGVSEVVRFDPEQGEIRIWDRVEGDLIERVVPSGEPAECVPLGVFWVVVRDDASRAWLRLARDRDGKDLLPTPEEAALVERDAALAQVKALEAELAKRG